MTRRRWLIAGSGTALLAAVAIAATVRIASGAKTPVFKNDTEKASYAVGVNLARQLRTIAGDLDAEALAQGFNDGRSDGSASRLTNAEMTATLTTLRKTQQQRAKDAHASAGQPATKAVGVAVFFKMDPRLSASYGGERWVSPATYTQVGDATSAVIDVRAQGRGEVAKVKPADLQWSASDPGMVDVSPGNGAAVKITVKRPGTSTIRLIAGNLTKELAVKAETRNDALNVAISQQ